jgi:IS5 family transposase
VARRTGAIEIKDLERVAVDTSRAAIEPVIGHRKDDHRMRRNHLKGRDGDRINAVLAAAGYNFNLLLRWFEEFLRATFLIVLSPFSPPHFV